MNIIKLRDIVMPETCALAKFFNKNLKGKYAYWIQMRYIFPMDSLDYKTYIQYEQYDHVHFLGPTILPHIDLYSEECSMYDFAQVYVDIETTEAINNVNEYSFANDYVADFDVDITKLRNFRSWLAAELLKFNTGITGEYLNKYSNEETHMLEYYKNGMYNDVIKYLEVFGYQNAVLNNSATTCGCCSSSSITFNLNLNNSCDAKSIYVNNLHALMVQTFENVNFWMQFNKEFIKTFKKYIDNIVKTGLIVNTVSTNKFVDCNCSNSSGRSSNEMLLVRLSEALQYIIDDDTNNHKNFIHDALYNWAEYLYDHMQWKI